MSTFRLKFELWVNIVWGLFILFFSVGIIAGYGEKAALGLLVSAATWTVVEIYNRALASVKMLNLLNNGSFDVLLGDFSRIVEKKKKNEDDETE